MNKFHKSVSQIVRLIFESVIKAVRVNDAASRAHRQLFNHEYSGDTYANLNLIVNDRDIAITLNDGSLIYNS